MNIYILSDDFFFSLGLAGVLTNAGHNTTILDIFERNTLDCTGNRPGIIIIDIHDRERLRHLFHNEVSKENRLVFVTRYDVVDEHRKEDFNIFIPRKIACERIVPWLKKHAQQGERKYHKLSECEKTTLTLLLSGESPCSISTKLNISIKTISRHKINALNKLGVKKMNSKSLLYISDYVYKTSFLSSFNNRVIGCQAPKRILPF